MASRKRNLEEIKLVNPKKTLKNPKEYDLLSILSHLPEDAVSEVIGNLDYKGLASLNAANRQLQNLTEHEHKIWKQCENETKYGHLCSSRETKEDDICSPYCDRFVKNPWDKYYMKDLNYYIPFPTSDFPYTEIILSNLIIQHNSFLYPITLWFYLSYSLDEMLKCEVRIILGKQPNDIDFSYKPLSKSEFEKLFLYYIQANPTVDYKLNSDIFSDYAVDIIHPLTTEIKHKILLPFPFVNEIWEIERDYEDVEEDSFSGERLLGTTNVGKESKIIPDEHIIHSLIDLENPFPNRTEHTKMEVQRPGDIYYLNQNGQDITFQQIGSFPEIRAKIHAEAL